MLSQFTYGQRLAWLLVPVMAVVSLGAVPVRHPAPTITTEQLVSRLSASIENLRFLRCTVRAQERIGSKINQTRSQMKISFKPLRVYIKNQKNIEVLWVTGQNDGDAWVYPASFPYVTLSLDPNASLMRRNQHHTVLQAGFGTIADLLRTTGLRQDNTFSRSFHYVGDSTLQGRSSYVLRSDFPQFKYVSYKAGRNETVNSIADRFGCGEFRILERNNLSPGASIAEGKVVQVPNAYGRRTIVCIDPKTFLPMLIYVVDDKGLFEKFEFSEVQANQPIPLEEFSTEYKGYHF